MAFERHHIKSEIGQLPCFTDMECKIDDITPGYSNLCFKVTTLASHKAKKNYFFVKYLADHHAVTAQESLVAEFTAAAGLSPQVIYRDPYYLVTEFIVGEMLATSSLALEAKLKIAVNILARCHQISPEKDIKALSISEIVFRQLASISLSERQEKVLMSIAQQVTDINESETKVLCHGDANFANMLVDINEKHWLIDFECAFIGCREFDVAMLMAINRLPLSYLKEVCDAYRADCGVMISQTLVNQYLASCYFINGLWFYQHANNRQNSSDYLQLAKQQLHLFDQLKLVAQQVVELLFAD